jgi:hypothetical protein
MVLYLINDMWDTTIENVPTIIYQHEGIDAITGQSNYFCAIHQIVESRWAKSYTPSIFMAHSLVPGFFSESWLELGGRRA